MESLPDRDVLTPEQIALYLQVRKETVYRYIRERKLPAVRLGRAYRVPREYLDLFMLSNTTVGDVGNALFGRVRSIGDRNADVPEGDVQADVAGVVAQARRAERA